jgi:hypothetical protein
VHRLHLRQGLLRVAERDAAGEVGASPSSPTSSSRAALSGPGVTGNEDWSTRWNAVTTEPALDQLQARGPSGACAMAMAIACPRLAGSMC